jgi:lipopolysaccharide export system protein LptA
MTRARLLRLTLLTLLVFALSALFAGLLCAEGTKKLRVEATHIDSKKPDPKSSIRITTLTKAKIFHENSTFVAETIVMESQDDVHKFTCTGSPVFKDEQNVITADKVVGLSTPRQAEFTGTVKMVHTPKAKAKDDKDAKAEKKGETRDQFNKEPTTLTADSLSYNYADKLGKATGNVVVVQKARTIWADEGIYDEQVEKILLRGNVRLKNAGDEELKELKDADSITVSLKDDWYVIEAKPDGVVTILLDVKDKDAKKDEKKPEPKTETKSDEKR